jgi:hypothetical protein
VASRCRAAGDSVGGFAFGVVLRAGRAAAGPCIASDLADLAARSDICHLTLLPHSSTHTLHRSQACPVRWELAIFLRAPPTCPTLSNSLPAASWTGTAPPSRSSPGRLLFCGIFRPMLAQTQLNGKFRGQCRLQCRVKVTCAALQPQTSTCIPLFFCTIPLPRQLLGRLADLLRDCRTFTSFSSDFRCRGDLGLARRP